MKSFRWTTHLAFIAILIAGCQNGSDESKTSNKPEEVTAEASHAEVIAMKAKDELGQRLSAKLMQAVAADGPAAAITVCSEAAIPLTKQVGEKHGVRIGRTSFKQRNPDNKPPQWAEEFVKNRVAVKQTVTLDEGTSAFLLPIFLQPQCMGCHGSKDQMREDVKTNLAKIYPKDQATGFKEGDLRGWFWIEVPAEAGK